MKGRGGLLLARGTCNEKRLLVEISAALVLFQATGVPVIPDLDYGQTIAVKVILHRHVLDVYLDDRHVLSRAVYDYRDGQFGLFVEDAEAEFGALVANTLVE